MSNEIKTLEPTSVWEIFYALTQIPRPSKNERNAALFVKAFGEKLGFETLMDDVGNVVIRKPATSGLENLPGVILQGHIDMVPQSNSGVNFNFDTDPIDAYVDGDWVTARDTTLGADNGIGVSIALSILQSADIPHGPLEVLVTIDEETGMTGAFALEPGFVKGSILINLDSENEEDISVGCAGGMNVNFDWRFNDEPAISHMEAYQISIAGLKGGHSGLDIHLGRGNACKMMGQLLKKAIAHYGGRLSSVDCGNMRNAIPREAFATVLFPIGVQDKIEKLVALFQDEWTNELGNVEPELKTKVEKVDMPLSVIPEMVQDDIVNAVCAAPNAVIRMSNAMSGVVETSTNLSILKSSQGKVEGMCLTRSFVDSAKYEISSSLESCFKLAGAHVTFDGEYPGWKPNPESAILKVMKEVYVKQKGSAPNVVAMHAGLECGILAATYPNLDMVAVGPTICHPHSPDEKVNIASVNRFYQFLTDVLGNVK